MKTMRNFAVAALLVGLLSACAGITSQTDPGFGTPSPAAVDPYVETSRSTVLLSLEPDLSGTIRWVNSTTWVALDDAGHQPTGIDSVELLSNRVRVHYETDIEKVGSCQVTPDEAFASADVRVGASVGLEYLDVYFYMPSYGATPVPPSLLSKAGANVWITCFHPVPAS